MAEIFVDTGAWLALADKRDQYHKAATAVYPQILHQYPRLITTNLVIAETYNLIRRRLGHQAGISFLSSLRQTSRLKRIYTNDAATSQAEAILKQYNDQDFSLVDAVSFVVMHEQNSTQVFAFDHHFQVMGFNLVP